MLINIELKGPLTDEVKCLYDYGLACHLTHELIKKYESSKNVMVSSFCPEIVQGMLQVRGSEPYVIHRLANRNYMPEIDYTIPEGVAGLNIAEQYLDNSIMESAKLQLGTIGVWFGKSKIAED